MGVASYIATRLRPELVVLAGTEPAKLRALMRVNLHPQGEGGSTAAINTVVPTASDEMDRDES
jgi:hypothetical protein